MSFTLKAQQYKSFERLQWAPRGVCALVGRNGSGKTTALWTTEVLRLAIESDLAHALSLVGGNGDLRRHDAPDIVPTEVSLSVGELTWTIRPERDSQVWERVTRGAEVLVERNPRDNAIKLRGTHTVQARTSMALTRAYNADDELAKELRPLMDLVTSYRVYGDYELRTLRETGSTQTNDVRLNSSGTNVFAVIDRWRTQSDHEHRWSFVRSGLTAAFPKFFLTFDSEPAGSVISLVVRTPQKKSFRPQDWPNGFFSMLLGLCAVAGANDGGVVALDEPETSLHPELIRSLVGHIRDWSVEHAVTVLMSTHSPALLDCFKEQPEQVYVMERGSPSLPARLDELHEPGWLRHFSLGDLYEHNKFGGAKP